jgi:hypothetical protein
MTGSEPYPRNHRIPPARAYLGFLAEELDQRGLHARVYGQGLAAYLTFEDPRLRSAIPLVYFHEPLSGPATFIFKGGATISTVNDRKAAASVVEKLATAS